MAYINQIKNDVLTMNYSKLVSPMDYESLAQQIVRVLEKAELRDGLIRNGIKTAQAYSWRNTALRHEEFYSRIVDKSNHKKSIYEYSI